MRYAMSLTVLFCSLSAFAGWGGIREGEAQTIGMNYQNCDLLADFFVNTAKGTFEVAKLDYSCALEDGSTVFQAYSDIRMTIEGTDLRLNGQTVGYFSDEHVNFDLGPGVGGNGASYQFDLVPGTAAVETRIIDARTGYTIVGRLW